MRRFNIIALHKTLGLKVRKERRDGEQWKMHMRGVVEGIGDGLVEWVACEIANTLSNSILDFYPEDHVAHRFKLNPESLIKPDGSLEVNALPNFYLNISPPHKVKESIEAVIVKVEFHYFGGGNQR